MTPTVERAILALQKKCLLTPRQPRKSAAQLELYERAIDKLLRNPDQNGNAFRIMRNALSDARAILMRRGELLPLSDLEEAQVPFSNGHDTVVELKDWLESSLELTESDRNLLFRIAKGDTAEGIADDLGVPVNVVRVRISRARASARRAWAVA